MKLWLLLVGVFLVQEPVTSGAVLLAAYQLHYNIWVIHGIFVAATLFDIVVGYYIGAYLHKKSATKKIGSALQKRLNAFSAFIGKNGKIVALVVYSPFIFPISPFFFPWLDISLTEALIYSFIGEVIFWYALEWIFVLGIQSVIGDPITALYTVMVVATIIALGIKWYLHKKRGSRMV